ncbi:hypothetical protein MtrunA17_Chr1g0173281 [Medicago truncatula]|uniref:Uncharacterized protein n=1 Tax=Medicago truncatula TaxID=3880 RepID=A0A396JNX9_MEDTR|nr:hypothetical protein MtrunA17_Chr1g0173281 [Medicago truncatula]
MSRLQGKHHNHDNDTPVIPPRNPREEIKIGMEFTGIIDGIIPAGYLLTMKKGNGVTFRMFAFDQPSLIQGDGNVNVPLVASNVSLNTNEEIPELEVDDDFSLDYSYFPMTSPSNKIQMPDVLQYFGKFEPVVFQPVNQTNSSNKGKGLSIDLNSAPTPNGHRISKDPFLARKFPSPTVNIRPPDDLIAKTSRPSKQGLSSHNHNPKITIAKQ